MVSPMACQASALIGGVMSMSIERRATGWIGMQDAVVDWIDDQAGALHVLQQQLAGGIWIRHLGPRGIELVSCYPKAVPFDEISFLALTKSR